MIMAGSALANTCDIVIEKGRKGAAHILEASEADIEFHDGIFSVAGTDRTISLMEVARQISGLAQNKVEIPEVEIPTSLDSTGSYRAPDFHFPNGCHVSEIEIDPETGSIEVLRYTAVDDVGTMINTHVVHGQVHGGIAQGLGQVLFENCVYDDEGPVPHRVVYGLRHAARQRSSKDRCGLPARSLAKEPIRRERGWRMRCYRFDSVPDERYR
ncbi:MAG: molybdopterin cofactor-binding domain-containing protein [Bradyrhizobium sp.]